MERTISQDKETFEIEAVPDHAEHASNSLNGLLGPNYTKGCI